MDYGKDHYATVSWSDAPDNRRVLIGWMSNWQYAGEVPTMQYRSANTLPREAGLFRAPDGQLYLSSSPVAELGALRDKPSVSVRNKTAGGNGRNFPLPDSNGGACEILLDIDSRKAASVDITISNNDGESVILSYDTKAHTLSFDRRRSGITDFSQDFPTVTTAPTFETDGKLSLRIFIDRSSIEVFGNGGKTVMTNLVFPTVPYSSVSVSAKGGNTRIENLKIYPIKEL